MRGESHPDPGSRSLHIEAARDWLRRAEEQLAEGESVLAAATLMLAQAEIKLLIEGVAERVAVEVPGTHRGRFQLAPLFRSAAAVAALAACLILGIVVGRVTTQGPAVSQDGGISVSQVPAPVTIQPFPPFGPPAPSQEASEPVLAEGPSAVLSAEVPEPGPARQYRTRPVSPQPVLPEPASSFGTLPAPEPAVEPRPPLPAALPEAPEYVVQPAEVALETVRALNERLAEGAAER